MGPHDRGEAAAQFAASLMSSAVEIDATRRRLSGDNDELNQLLWDLEAVALGHAQRAAEDWWNSTWPSSSSSFVSSDYSHCSVGSAPSTNHPSSCSLRKLFAALIRPWKLFTGMRGLLWKQRSVGENQESNGSAII